VSDLDLRDEPYDGPAAIALTAAVQLEYVSRYGDPDETPVDPQEFVPPDGRFVIGYLDGVPVAMGGLRRLDENRLEIKRMYVDPAWRGRGLARVVLARLEELAREMGAGIVVLETGDKQPEAIALYTSSGYEPVDKYGHYRCSPLSVSLGKTL
jgi:GNAT superfamily N-acetyltransferase